MRMSRKRRIEGDEGKKEGEGEKRTGSSAQSSSWIGGES